MQNSKVSGYEEYLQKKQQEKVLRQQTLTQIMSERASRFNTHHRDVPPLIQPLPSGWSTYLDHGSGRSFFLNDPTQEIVFSLSKVYKFEDRKMEEKERAKTLLHVVAGPTPGFAGIVSLSIPSDQDSVTVDQMEIIFAI
jgi:hypothetical protein